MQMLEIDNIDHLEQYADAWTTLLNGVSECSTIFLTPEYVLNWWKYFGDGGKLSVLMLFEDNSLVGVAPLAISQSNSFGLPRRILRFVGSRQADHLDFYIEPDFRREGMTKIFEYIMTNLQWDVMDLLDFPNDSENVSLLRELLDSHHLVYSIEPCTVCPYLQIKDSDWDAFYARKRSKSTRKDLLRRLRRLSELGHLEFRRYEDPADIEYVFPQLFAVYEKRWDKKNNSSAFIDKKKRLFYKDMAVALSRRGKIDILTLELDGRVIAFTLSAFNNTQFTWLFTAHVPAFRKFFLGELILTHLLEDVFRPGSFHEFDFTRGDEPYKYKWAEGERSNLRILVCNRSMISKVPYLTFLFYSFLRKEARKSEFLRKIKLDIIGQLKSIVNRT
jgi:CelD/BcsL family acetyltransferase involved in cellulose biosynthesis